MGWLFGWGNRKSLINHLISENGVVTHAHCFKGNNMWAVQECQGKKFIALYLLRGRNDSRDGWGYKDVSEDMGPLQVNCPLGYLDMVDEPYNNTAREWREKVREWHAARAVKKTTGDVVQYAGRKYQLHNSLGRRGWTVLDVETGYPYRMKPGQIKEAVLCPATS